jgi:CheY-like chemotaxis protein
VDDLGFNINALLIILKYSLRIDTSELCVKAFNGQEALDKVMENVEANQGNYCNFDLIFMDCNMPFMDGYEATEKIREFLHSKGLKQPIISAVTGHTE